MTTDGPIAGSPAPSAPYTIRCKFERPRRGGRIRIVEPSAVTEGTPETPAPPIPTLVRSLVRAHAYENLIRSGAASSYADIAGTVKLTTARLCQLAALLNLAPDIQAEILDFARLENRGDAVDEHIARQIAGEPDWAKQREAWRQVRPREAPTAVPVADSTPEPSEAATSESVND